jgi:hypothetical protein
LIFADSELCSRDGWMPQGTPAQYERVRVLSVYNSESELGSVNFVPVFFSTLGTSLVKGVKG